MHVSESMFVHTDPERTRESIRAPEARVTAVEPPDMLRSSGEQCAL